MSNLKKILIVIDPQKDFVDGSLGSELAQSVVPDMVKKIDGFDGHIIVTQDTHHDNYILTSEGRNLPVIHCLEGTDGWRVCDEVRKALHAASDRGLLILHLYKETFGSLQLPETVRSLPMDVTDDGRELDICLIGLDTDICVLANALILKTRFPEAYVHVDANCTAGSSVEATDAAFKCMLSCQIGLDNWIG